MSQGKRAKKSPHTLVVSLDPAKSSDGGIAAFYDGELIYYDRVLMWDPDEVLDIYTHFENIRAKWLDEEGDPDSTRVYLYYERPQNGAHFARAAISEAAGAAFPCFTRILGGKKKDCISVMPRDWRPIIDKLICAPGCQLSTEEWKRASLAHASICWGYDGTDHNISDAICIGHYGLVRSGVEPKVKARCYER